ncbi:hypothetical protein N7492_004994 [Penicillium capsulatum]|uniref:Uncharacterized protein n=1 Tax=Penicillium capsulatum TaxID=69766 RepID=A0A9W9I8Z9_9EURO|nr:hypothetical protein N7492_004994 [Penicillium capsulatum]KAJ6135899.1 hypothetical protein N7512_001059 [Penicillium capsulatum]
MAGKAPQPAFVEDFDDVAHDIVPDSRQVANTAAKLSRLDFRSAEPLIDGASDSGYSSRTAATVNSTQSGPSGGKSPPVPLKLDMPKRADLTRNSSSRKDRKDKDRARPARDEKMQVGAYPAHLTHVPRSPSKPRRRDSVHVRQYPPEGYYEGYYPPSTPVDTPRAMEYGPPPAYLFRPPVPDYTPTSPQHSRFPHGAIAEYHASRPSGRPVRSNTYRSSYHSERPQSWAMGSSPIYHQQIYPYDPHGPPPSSSAYSNAPYSSSPYGGGSFYTPSDYTVGPEYGRDRSRSRHREPSRARRASVVYAAPPDEVFPEWLEDGEPLEQYYSREPPRESRGRPVKLTQEYDEDRHRMPPPPPPPPKHKSVPQIHQARRPEPRKAQTTQSIPSSRRPSRAMDLTDLDAALPDEYDHRRSSREARLPERSGSLRDSKRSTSYHDHARGAKVAVEHSRRRRAQQYYYEDRGSSNGGLEDREREIERYQAAQAGRSTAPLPLSTEALIPKSANGAGSENGSQKSRSNSSRGSGTGSKAEDKNMTLIMNGMTIGFAEESLMGKSISIRTGDAGAMHLNIADGTPAAAAAKRPKNYITGGSSYSDYTGGSSRRELEDVPRRNRDDRRSERPSRRSSRSSYGPTRYQV